MISSSQKRRRNRNKRTPRAMSLPKVENSLRQIADADDTQARALVPRIRDVPRMVMPRMRPVTIARQFSYGTITPSASVDQTGGLSFNLSQLPDNQEFTGLFDQYRIMQVEVQFIPTAMNNVHAPLWTAIDYDDSNAVVSINSFLEYETCSAAEPATLVCRRFTPRVADALYTNTFTGYGIGPAGTWINSSSPGVQHYGLKYYMTSLSTSSTVAVYTVWVRMVCQFKSIF